MIIFMSKHPITRKNKKKHNELVEIKRMISNGAW